MSLTKNQFVEKEMSELFHNHTYVLLFHYNNMTSKEWIHLKKTLFQINPSIQSKVVPNRFLLQMARSASTRVSFDQYDLGSSCLFFSSNQQDLKKILNFVEQFGGRGSFTVRSSSIPSCPSDASNTHKFINIGMIEMSLPDIHGEERKQPKTGDSANQKSADSFKNPQEKNALFFSSYDLKRFLSLNHDIFSQLHETLNNNINLVPCFQKLLNFSTNNLPWTSHDPTLFKAHHYGLLNIFSIMALKGK